jgi:hypothetical protein
VRVRVEVVVVRLDAGCGGGGDQRLDLRSLVWSRIKRI